MKRIKIKTIFCHVAIIAICMGVFCHGYMGVSLSVYDGFNVYAQDSWEDVNQDDLVTAFRYYCKSRNLAIEGSVADALTSFTTTTFNNICNTLGINVSSLQADLKKTVEGNLGLRFLMNQQGVLAYNRIFAEFLQNNDLEVGDEVDKTIYSGKYFSDGSNSCLCFVVDSLNASSDLGTIRQYGSQFVYNQNDIIASSSGTVFPLSIFSTDYSLTSSYGSYSNYMAWSLRCAKSGYTQIISIFSRNGAEKLSKNGYVSIAFNLQDNKFHLVTYFINQNNIHNVRDLSVIGLNDYEPDDASVYITTNNNTINNNNYNNNYTIIYNDGDTYITDDDDEPLPTTPPGGGGGGGGDNPDDWNPTTPTIPGPSSPDFPSIDLPDIDIPDLPSLNFSLGDLREKFPFSLPFDIIAVLNVLDGEPKAPHIEATVPIGQWYTWEIDFDFSEFDNYARLFRAFEFIGFCIGLAVFTVHFVKG